MPRRLRELPPERSGDRKDFKDSAGVFLFLSELFDS